MYVVLLSCLIVVLNWNLYLNGARSDHPILATPLAKTTSNSFTRRSTPTLDLSASAEVSKGRSTHLECRPSVQYKSSANGISKSNHCKKFGMLNLVKFYNMRFRIYSNYSIIDKLCAFQALKRRRSNFKENQFPLAYEAARKADVAIIRNKAFNQSRAFNVNKPSPSVLLKMDKYYIKRQNNSPIKLFLDRIIYIAFGGLLFAPIFKYSTDKTFKDIDTEQDLRQIQLFVLRRPMDVFNKTLKNVHNIGLQVLQGRKMINIMYTIAL
ncbi:hypothetical protein ACS0TY_026521 [Phlomoides rotata]